MRNSLVKRSYTEEDFHKLINAIERDIQKTKKRELPSVVVGELVMRHLEKFDKVGYIRFASVYRQFEDVRRFQREINKFLIHSPIKRRKKIKRRSV